MSVPAENGSGEVGSAVWVAVSTRGRVGSIDMEPGATKWAYGHFSKTKDDKCSHDPEITGSSHKSHIAALS